MMDIHYNGKKKTTENHTMLLKTKVGATQVPLKIIVPAPLMTSVVILFNDTNTIWYYNRVEHLYTSMNPGQIY